MWLFSSVDQIVFLQVSQLREAFITGLTLKWPLAAVDTQVHLGTKTGKLGVLPTDVKTLDQNQNY